MRDEKRNFPQTSTSLCDQFTGRTQGTAEVDVYTSIAITINTSKVHKVPLEVWEPIGKALSVLLIGRPSATRQGVFGHPGVIDADFT